MNQDNSIDMNTGSYEKTNVFGISQKHVQNIKASIHFRRFIANLIEDEATINRLFFVEVAKSENVESLIIYFILDGRIFI